MKYLTCLLVMVLSLSSMDASLKVKNKKNPKKYIQGNELFLFPHGIYLAYPGKLYKIKSLYYSQNKGYFTYRSKMKHIPLSQLNQKNWEDWNRLSGTKL